MMKKFRDSILISIVGIILVSQPVLADGSKGVDLAQMNGWDIVVAKDAIESESYAAEEFQTFFAQASGVKLPIAHRIDRPDRHVFIGPGKPMQTSKAGFSIDGFGREDLRIIVGDNNIVIAGGRPRGTLFGVYTFLEDYVGLRFLTAEHTHVPPIGEQRLIKPVDSIYRPPFANYRASGYQMAWQDPTFGIRHRINAIYDPKRKEPQHLSLYLSPFINIGHSFYRQVPHDKYGKDHPEYFGLWDGKRMNDFVHTHLCLTNPDLVPIVTQAVLEEVEHPSSAGRLNFAVSQNDTIWQYCQCDKCAAIDGPEESHMGALLKFVNTVADEVAKTRPDVFVGALSYGFSRKPPKTIKPRANVQINLSNIEACQIHAPTDPNCALNVHYMQDLNGWSKICEHLYAWTYNVNFNDHLLPYPNLHTIKPTIQTLQAAGARGVFMQCCGWPTAEFSDLRHYLITRLLWNPDLDDSEIIDEFLSLHYGKAAPPIRRFIDLVHKHYATAGIHHSSCIKARWDLLVDESVAQAGLKMFVEAIAGAENETIKARVEKASICAYRAAIDPVWTLQEEDQLDPATATRMRPLVKEFFRLCDAYGIGGKVAGNRQRIEGILGTTDR